MVGRRIRSCVDTLGDAWERDKVERTAKHYDDDDHGKYVELRLLPLASVILAARALPPQTNRRRIIKTSRGENTRRSTGLHCALSTCKYFGGL